MSDEESHRAGHGKPQQQRFDAIARLFEQALALPEQDRLAFLRERAPGDPIRAEVERLLARAGNIDPFFRDSQLSQRARARASSALSAAPASHPRGEGGALSESHCWPEMIGPYRIVRPLGRGGMGVVTLARDTHLDRLVAIKALPREFSGDLARIRRFQREARVVAALQHPNIGAIHHLEHEGGEVYLILEYVEGEDLADRLRRGPPGVSEGLAICAQVAAALEAAHARGIIHRDLKPSNVIVGRDRRVKVLDFGLARWIGTESTTLGDATAVTSPGGIVGTPGYMSPEQARGEQVDTATDIWAFGCVLYECLTGERAFPGGTPMDAIASTLRLDVPLDGLPPETPAEVRNLLAACLTREPGARLDAIAEARVIIEQALSNPAAKVAAPTAAAASDNLPAELTTFIGRRTEIEIAVRLLESSRLLTVVGAGGCGKTRLALRLAARVKPMYPDGVWFIGFGSLNDPALVPQTVAAALSIAENANQPIAATIAEALRRRRALLIFDTCEHLVDACRSLAETLLVTCSHINVLATSREALGLAGEQLYRVPSLSVPAPEDDANIEALRRTESVALFLARTRLVRADFDLTPDNALHVAQICRRVDGIPLAIELAAARMRSLSAEQISERLGSCLDLLSTATKGSVPRQQTLRATVDWSSNLLTEPERTLFRRLSVFRGGWTLEGAAVVCAHADDSPIEESQAADLLDRLVDRSMVIFDDRRRSGARYTMADTIRQYAEEMLIGAGEADAIRRLHLAFHDDLARTAEPNLIGGAGQEHWLNRIALEHDNFRAAMAWSFRDGGDADQGLAMAAAVHRFWFLRGFLTEGRMWLANLNQRTEKSDELTAKVHKAAGILAAAQGDRPAAQRHYEAALSIWSERGDDERRAAALTNLGCLALQFDDLEASRSLLEEALSIYEKEGNDVQAAQVRLNLAAALACAPDRWEDARSLLTICLPVFERTHDLQRIAAVHLNVGQLAHQQRDYGAAAASLVKSLEFALRIGDQRGIAFTLSRLARTRFAQEAHEEAAQLLAASEARRSRLGASFDEADMREIERVGGELRRSMGAERLTALAAAGETFSDDDLHRMFVPDSLPPA